MPTRRRFLAGSAAVLGATGAVTGCVAQHHGDEDAATPVKQAQAVPAVQAAAAERLNFVVILADDLGYGELGSYGQKLMHTPRIDALAAEGLRFTQAYAPAPVCAPSRCSLLTGLHGGHATVRRNPSGADGQGTLTERDFTFAEALRARGYRTGIIGKWGFGPEAPDQPSHPNSRGFEEFYGYITHHQAHDYYPDYLWHNGVREEIPQNRDGARVLYAPDLLQRHALDYIDARKDEPFLLYLAPTVPHAPSRDPDLGSYADESWTHPNKAHAAQVTTFDTLVGEVTDRLTALGIAHRTLVLVSSDNGPHEEGGVDPDLFDGNGPLRGYKRNLYEGGIRVPLIAWRPQHIAAGTSDRPTPLTDVLPTLAELAGAPAPADVDGLSIAPLLNGTADTADHDHLYFYRNHNTATPRANAVDHGRARHAAEALRRGDWKAVRFAPGRDRNVPDDQWDVELYDLARDLGEQHDLAAARPAEADALVKLMHESWVEPFVRRPFGLTLQVTGAGTDFTLTATLANGSARPWTEPRLDLQVPAGWHLADTGTTAADRLTVGDRLTARWTLTRTPDTGTGTFTCRATADYAGRTVTYTAEAGVG
ncbi:Cerebroside-sulfatase [Actinobacteria bacterium OK074]|nr:Cerebroside-sulfatase [Actinobacteria bacterium OK074]